METFNAILRRRVVRSFTKQPVPPELLEKLIEAGRHAMSARNLQPWQFILIRNPERLRELSTLCTTGRFVADAPSAIVVLKDASNARWADIDCAQAVQNMATAAWSLGLGTCWVGNFDGAKIAQLLDVPSGWAVFTILPFGYPDPSNPPQGKALKPRQSMIHHERFGQSTVDPLR
jgi:nitroreductase